MVGVKQSNTRDEGKRNFTKHLIRLRRVDGEKYKVGDTVAEMLLKNANDGTCQYELMAGLFRILCLNSLVAQKAEIESIKVRHSGNHKDTITKVIEGTFRVVDEAEIALEAPKQWSRIDLNSDEKQIFAEAVHEIRFGETEPGARPTIQPLQLLKPRRFDDHGDDLWRVFNVAQEHVIRGGDHGVLINERGERRRTSTRQVNGIDADVRLNKALWSLGEKMAALKKAA